MRSTRREFLGTSSAGLGLLAGTSLSWLSGCATTAKGDVMPKRGPRVAVIGGGWGGATVAKYVRLIPSLAGQAPAFLKTQMILFKQDKRNPGDASLNAAKALMRLISDETYADLAAYYSSVR